MWRRIALGPALLIAAVLVACTRAENTDRERQLAAAQIAHRSFTQWYGQPSDETPPSAVGADRAIYDAVAQRFWAGPNSPTLSESMRLALVAFSVDRLARELGADEYPIDASFLDGAIVWPIRTVRIGSPPPHSSRETLALMTLERYMGWAVLQRTLAEWRARFAGRSASASDLLQLAGEISGRHLQWMDGLFDRARTYDYGIDRVETRQASQSTHRVDIVTRRYGDGTFAGRGLTIAVTFADGQEMVDVWDGRAAEHRLTYESTAPLISAAIDPDGIVVVDRVRANNLWTADASRRNRAGSAAFAWTVRWSAWLQDRLLLWSALF